MVFTVELIRAEEAGAGEELATDGAAETLAVVGPEPAALGLVPEYGLPVQDPVDELLRDQEFTDRAVRTAGCNDGCVLL